MYLNFPTVPNATQHIIIGHYLLRNDVTDVLLVNAVKGLAYKVTPTFLGGYFLGLGG